MLGIKKVLLRYLQCFLTFRHASGKRCCISVLFLLLLLCVPTGLFSQAFFADGQSPRFGQLGRAEGLKSLSISSVQQDVYGFLWFGSQGGLNRYDGRTITCLQHDPFNTNSLPNDLVQTLFYDQGRNLLWIGTYNGLSQYDIDTETFTNFSYNEDDRTSLSNNIVVSIAKDDSGRIWVGTLNGLNRMSVDEESFERVETNNPTIRSLLLDSSGRLWIGTYGGIQYWDGDREQMVTPHVDLPSTYVMDIQEPEPGRLLLGMWDGGMADYWPETGKLRLYNVPDKKIYTVLESDDGTKWAGSWGGGLTAVPTEGTPVWFKNSDTSEIANSIVYSLFEDDAGLVWVGTNGGGINYLSPRRRNYRAFYSDPKNPNSIAEGKIEAIYRDSEGTLWLGIYSGGLNRIDEDTGKVTIYKHNPEKENSLSNDIINCIFEDSSNNFWVCTNEGLNRFDRDTGNFELWSKDIHPEHPLSNRIVYWITEDHNGRLWIGTYGGGVDRFDPRTEEMVNFQHREGDPSSLSDNIVYRCIETSNGDVWISTNYGLNRYISDDEGFIRYFHHQTDPDTISANNIRSIVEDSQGRLWVGTYSGGLNRYESHGDRFIHYTTRNGMAGNNILSILEGDDNRIWCATRAGINILNPKTGEIKLLDERDGLFGVFFNFGNLKDEDGSLYFGGSHGVTKIDSSRTYTNPHPPKVHITSVNVFEKPLESPKAVFDDLELTFQSTENFLSFEFIALDFESPRHNRYAYKMEGFDREWIQADTRSYASYTNLPPGTYRFQVIGSNNDELWNEEGASLTIHVKAPWYLKWWAFLLYGIAGVGILTITWRLRSAQLLRQQNAELEYTNRLLERANADLERLSIHDSLTDVFNRRYFESSFYEEWQRARRGQYHIALLMIDIDHFKQFNDTYGHIAGDRALELVAQTIQGAVPRHTDFVARYGGEEFAAVLFQTDITGGAKVAEKIKDSIEHLKIPVSQAGEEVQEFRKVSVSIGVHAAVPDGSAEPEDFIHTADQALYLAKKEGRNTIKTLS